MCQYAIFKYTCGHEGVIAKLGARCTVDRNDPNSWVECLGATQVQDGEVHPTDKCPDCGGSKKVFCEKGFLIADNYRPRAGELKKLQDVEEANRTKWLASRNKKMVEYDKEYREGIDKMVAEHEEKLDGERERREGEAFVSDEEEDEDMETKLEEAKKKRSERYRESS